MSMPNYSGQTQIHIQSYLGNVDKIEAAIEGDNINHAVVKMGGIPHCFSRAMAMQNLMRWNLL